MHSRPQHGNRGLNAVATLPKRAAAGETVGGGTVSPMVPAAKVDNNEAAAWPLAASNDLGWDEDDEFGLCVLVEAGSG